MLDEFPALGRLDFFESALAFMAGYGLKSFLIAQSLNQIEKAYGPNNAILDNCHVRVALRHQRRAHRQARVRCARHRDRDAGDEELCRPPASPWLGHLMVSRQETARPLLTPGEVMQLPPTDELVLVSGMPADPGEEGALLRGPTASAERVLPPPALTRSRAQRDAADDWSALAAAAAAGRRAVPTPRRAGDDDDATDSERRHQPRAELPSMKTIEPEAPIDDEFEFARRRRRTTTPSAPAACAGMMQGVARQAALDPGDGMDL